ncbi:unnamed protein product, partial [Pylaiella littoralis]
DQGFWHLPHTHVGPHTSARGPRAEAKPLGSPEHCTSGASSPRFSDGRFAVGEDGHRHGGRALWTPLAPVVCGDRSYRHRRYDHFTLSLRQGCAPDD